MNLFSAILLLLFQGLLLQDSLKFFKRDLKSFNLFLSACQQQNQNCKAQLQLFKKAYQHFAQNYQDNFPFKYYSNPSPEELNSLKKNFKTDYPVTVYFFTKNLQQKTQTFNITGQNESDMQKWLLNLIMDQ